MSFRLTIPPIRLGRYTLSRPRYDIKRFGERQGYTKVRRWFGFKLEYDCGIDDRERT